LKTPSTRLGAYSGNFG